MGEPAHQVLTPGNCQKIPTGGLLPPGADGVVMLEDTIPVDATMIEIVKGTGVGSNVIARGEDIAAGALALAAGTRLRPQDIGLLAGLGIAEVEVYRQVRVGILSTGDEIVPHHATPEPGTDSQHQLPGPGRSGPPGGRRIHQLPDSLRPGGDFSADAQAVTENDLVVLFRRQLGGRPRSRRTGHRRPRTAGHPGPRCRPETRQAGTHRSERQQTDLRPARPSGFGNGLFRPFRPSGHGPAFRQDCTSRNPQTCRYRPSRPQHQFRPRPPGYRPGATEPADDGTWSRRTGARQIRLHLNAFPGPRLLRSSPKQSGPITENPAIKVFLYI
jgi:hypothetical protein